MKKRIPLLFLLFSILSFSQEIVKVKGRYYSNNSQISHRHVRDLLTKNTEALSLFKKSQNKEALGGFFVGIGSALVTVDLAIGLFSDVKYPTPATYLGLASLLISVPILTGKNKKAQQAIDLYNEGLQHKGEDSTQPEINIIANQNGCGLQLRF
ncbi:hypothetical protein [Flavobacterium sp. UMI-01]|uniref:hypothetical protein n=1 Tax=Flavobacterium sp. UMI-01 TaxID=1441053 RepID=UPI001C7D0C05|nr:hypothetical protein [Flavobacterium sp. UMI-01]GIZ10515.1 hypothetical protein FUMI01_32390 [Flavobacterium sp. UMI-01]